MGKDDTIRLMEITWPSGVVQKIENIQADRVFTAKEPG
jgi:hypothetical protein